MSATGQQAPNSPQTFDQWIRKVGLVVSGQDGNGLNLSQFRVNFKIFQSDFETPNNAIIKVYNLASATAQQIRKEYTQVTLQAGYQNGAYGVVFQGGIKQVRIGRDSQTETYLEIYAADSDMLYNFGTIATNVAAGQTPQQQIGKIAQAMGAQVGDIQFSTGPAANVRGKVLYGMARTQLRNIARTGLSTWSIENGKVVYRSLTGYSSGEAVVINAQTGMINLPEQTEEGVRVRCLLNPKIVVGTQIQLNQDSIQQAALNTISGQGQSAALFSPNRQTAESQIAAQLPGLSADGFYYVMVAEHEGDTRDNDYYTTLTCLAVNKTTSQNTSVKAAG